MIHILKRMDIKSAAHPNKQIPFNAPENARKNTEIRTASFSCKIKVNSWRSVCVPVGTCVAMAFFTRLFTSLQMYATWNGLNQSEKPAMFLCSCVGWRKPIIIYSFYLLSVIKLFDNMFSVVIRPGPDGGMHSYPLVSIVLLTKGGK